MPKKRLPTPAFLRQRDEWPQNLIALEQLEAALLDAEGLALAAMWSAMNAGDVAAACELAVLRLDAEALWLAVYKLLRERLPPPADAA